MSDQVCCSGGGRGVAGTRATAVTLGNQLYQYLRLVSCAGWSYNLSHITCYRSCDVTFNRYSKVPLIKLHESTKKVKCGSILRLSLNDSSQWKICKTGFLRKDGGTGNLHNLWKSSTEENISNIMKMKKKMLPATASNTVITSYWRKTKQWPLMNSCEKRRKWDKILDYRN